MTWWEWKWVIRYTLLISGSITFGYWLCLHLHTFQ